MAKSEFICKACKKVKDAGFLGTHQKFKCPKCGVLCGSCVSKNLLFSNKCKKCNASVVTYSWDRNKSKWFNS